MSNEVILFEETFTITSLNNQKYDRVSRITATNSVSGNPDCALTLDLNTELYQVAVGENLTICLASTLAHNGTKDDGKAWRDIARGESTLADHYDYVCHGKIYKFEEPKDDGENENEKKEEKTIKVFVSFGGLLLYLEGPLKKLTLLRIDNVYLLCRKS